MGLIVSPTEPRNHPNLLGIRRWNRQLSRASKANPLDASPRPTDANFRPTRARGSPWREPKSARS